MLSAPAKALGLDYYGVESTINDDLTVKTILTVKFPEPVDSYEFNLLYKAYNLSATANFDSAQCTLSDDVNGSRIDCRFIGMTESKNLLALTLYARGGITSFQNRYNFSTDYGISSPVKSAFALIKIPKNTVLSEEVANESYFPNDGAILSDGKHIMVYWQRENLTASDGMKFSVSYLIPSLAAANNILVVSVAGIVIISMIAVAIYVRKGYGAESAADVMTSVLNKDEKRIVDILSRHGGKSGQKVLVRESDFSKAKVSRLVKNLKERGVVDIEPISGRENRIILKFDKKPDAEKPQEKESPQTVDVVEKPQKDPVIDTESYEPDEEITE
jgi:uncharacterized membrane protein